MEFLMILSFILITLMFLLMSLKIKAPNRLQNLPPGSMGWPLIGETLEYLSVRKVGVPHPFITKRIAKYGRVFKTNLFGCPTVINTDPELNRFILMKEGQFFQSKYPPSVAKLLGRFSMVQADGDLHKKMRGLTATFMQVHRLRDDFLKDVEEKVISRLSTWEGRVVYVQEEAQSLSFEFIVKQVLSMDPADDETQQLKQDFLTLVDGMVVPLKLPGTPYWKAMKRRDRIVKLIETTIARRKVNPPVRRDFLQTILEDSSGENFTLEQISDFLVFMLFAAHDTTATAMTMAFNYLMAHPKAFEELQKEHMEIGRSGALEWKDYLSMSFTQYVINETLRLTNILTSAHRVALNDIQLEGYVIPKGWKVLSNWTSVHLDPKIYPDPLKFDPWRWKIASTKYFTPFSGGSRLCTGAELARLEIAIFLHFAITKYSWKAAEQDEAICYGTVKMKKGLPIIVKAID